MLIEGIFAAIPTPFYPDERVYFRKLEANVARYSRTLLSGMVVLGSTGEAVALDDSESREVLKVAAESAGVEKVMIAGVGRQSVKGTVELAEAAARAGYDAVLVRTPTYYSNLMTTQAVLLYFRCVADRSPLPVLIYNIPKFVPCNIPVEVISELASHPNIIGMKDSTGSVERLAQLVEATRSAPRHIVNVTPIFEAVTGRMAAPGNASEGALVGITAVGGGTAIAPPPIAPATRMRTKDVGFQIMTGSASNLYESLEIGASGAILGFAACAPQACQEVYLAWKDHDPALAKEKQNRITAPSQRIVGALGISGVKSACDFNGYYGGRARTPLLPLTGEERSEVERLLAPIRN